MDSQEPPFYLTQFLTGHGIFCAYLFRMNRKSSPYCVYCPDEVDSVEHTFFKCKRWAALRETLVGTLAQHVDPQNMVAVMTGSKNSWDAVAKYIEEVLRTRKKEEPDEQCSPGDQE